LSQIQYPDDWKLQTVQESCVTITSGGTPSRTNPEFFGGKIPWVKMTDLKTNVILDTEEKLTDKGVKDSSAKLFPKNTVLIAMYTRDLGKTAMLGINAATNQAICGLQPKDTLLPKFLFYFLKSQIYVLKKLGRGGAQPNINQHKIKTLQIPLPLSSDNFGNNSPFTNSIKSGPVRTLFLFPSLSSSSAQSLHRNPFGIASL